jgi:hypothetical protein
MLLEVQDTRGIIYVAARDRERQIYKLYHDNEWISLIITVASDLFPACHL